MMKETTEKIKLIKKHLLTTQSQQKSYTNNRRRDFEPEVGDHIFLKISSIKGTMQFKKKGKVSHRFIELFESLEKVGAVSYRLALPPD